MTTWGVADVLASARRRDALRARGAIPPFTDVVRLVDDAADGCPGLVVERFGDVLRFEVRGPQLPATVRAAARALCATDARHAVALVRTRAGASELHVLEGAPPAAHVVTERGRRFLVRTADEDAAGAGIFVDHREGRRLVEEHARGVTVLNLFAHAGAFGVVATAGGAARVDHVDAARKCAPWAALNLALNGVDPRAHRFIVDDALAFLAKAAKKRAGYGIIVCDPPTTALRPDGSRFHVEKDLPQLAADACKALAPGGHLLLSCNDRALSVDDVERCARGGAFDAGVEVRACVEVPLPDDVPSRSDRALRPMRGVGLTIAP
jgi:23S rRNA G2069 N7-methylase RlmK/C1962 C5-methylase RlmI